MITYPIYQLAVTFGAGVQWREAYGFVQKQGRFIVDGICLGASVGAAGGWVMGGGHSIVPFLLNLALVQPVLILFYSVHS